ncbi:MAG: FMN-binding protein [Propioniciclava sp.]|uniref:FMN-binding protein n=1 Tax=Propioniciclava sp. TaxID=2038686 RepID=UPI0039E4BDB6
MDRHRTRALSVAAALGVVLFSGCSQPPSIATLPDGTFTGASQPDDQGAVGHVEFTVKDGTIVEASFVVKDADGTPHDADYGLSKATGQPVDTAFYQRAQAAIAAEEQYVARFKEAGDADKVEVIAGASLSHRQFLEAVEDALSRV